MYVARSLGSDEKVMRVLSPIAASLDYRVGRDDRTSSDLELRQRAEPLSKKI